MDGNVTVTIKGNVDVKNIGTYQVEYIAVDSAGNRASKKRVVNVISPDILVKSLNVTEKRCKSWNSIKVTPTNTNYFYKVNNNDWGRKYLDKNSTGIQCVFKFNDGGEKGGWYWGWPSNNDYQVKGYPEAMYGAKFKNIINPSSGFPALVSSIESVNVKVEYRDLNITKNYNIALEFWLHTEQKTSMNNIEYEIMFRFDPNGFHPHRTKIGEYNINGVIFDVYTNNRYDGTISRRFINFVARKKIKNISVDFKKILDYLTDLEFKDIPQRYMSGIEMGVEVIDGSGALVLERFDVDLKLNRNYMESLKIEEDFGKWSLNYSQDKAPFDKEIDVNGSGWKWRASNSRLRFRKKNSAVVQLQGAKNGYLYTIFDESFDLSDKNALFKVDGSIGNDFDYQLMLKDDKKWCISDNISNNSLYIQKSSWYGIDESDDLIDVFKNDSALPGSLNFPGSCDNFDFSNIRGFGIRYVVKSGKSGGYFRLRKAELYKRLLDYAVFENIVKENSVSPFLFGLCTTPNRRISTNQTFIDEFKKWVTYLRWPGGSMIEDYNLKDKSGKIYSVGEWTEYMKSRFPSLEFLIGVSSKRAYDGDWNATDYGYGVVNYLNKDYDQGWGDNGALSSPTNLKFIEIGNEPNLEGLNADKYGSVLKDYVEGIHKADSSVKILAPTTTHGEIANMLPAVLKNYEDYIDIVSVHNYTDNPKDYKSDIETVKSYIKDLMSDNSRRKKEDIKIAFTEYNSLHIDYRKGVYHSESWAKAIWHAETFSYFIQEGLYMASMWHAFFGGGHGVYTRDGTPYPLVSEIRFWRDNIDFTKHPKVLYSSSQDTDLIITPIEMDDRLVVFVVNSSLDDKTVSLKFDSHKFGSDVEIKTLSSTPLNEWYPVKDVADNVDVDRLRAVNPNADIFTDNGKTKIKFPKLDIKIDKYNRVLNNNVLEFTFPKRTVSVLKFVK